jgi:hypothetical protein
VEVEGKGQTFFLQILPSLTSHLFSTSFGDPLVIKQQLRFELRKGIETKGEQIILKT